jgi:ABC-type multidrug transport system ATPase subunit
LSKRLSGLGLVGQVSVSIEDPTIGSGTIRIHTEDAQSAIGKLINTLEKEKIRIRHFRSDEPTLEDVFLHLASRGLSEPD